MTNQATFSEPTWAIVELFGHQVISGQVVEVSIAGSAMLRVDVPAIQDTKSGDLPGFTKFFGGGAIYAITPTDEASARHAVLHLRKRPIQQYTIPFRELPAPHMDIWDTGDAADVDDDPRDIF